MPIQDLKQRTISSNDEKLIKVYGQFKILLHELRTREFSDSIVVFMNTIITEIDRTPENELRKKIKKTRSKILKLLEKEAKIVPKNYYQKTWMVLGMTVFGIPMGVIFGTSLGNMSFIGIGLPIGMALGIAIGSQMDKKAFEEGRQLNLEF